MNNYKYKNTPLADRARPSDFDEMVGQRHLVAKGGSLRSLVETGRIPSMVFFGPPGCGKTTAASIIAAKSGMELRCLNATTAALADIRKVAEEADSIIGQNGILLYLDEIQYFNKKQQQSLLEYIEDGRITLITSTTENPYYYIYDALLSRLSVFEFKPVTAADIALRLRGVFRELTGNEPIPDGTEDADCGVADNVNNPDTPVGSDSGDTDVSPNPADAGKSSADDSKSTANSGKSTANDGIQITEGAVNFIAGCAGGDVRRALTMLELSLNCAEGSTHTVIDADFVRSLTPSVAAGRFDADGDVHYDLLSALQKSIRGSDPDAALFYLARLLEGGDIISPCRRLMVIASEDIGQAYPMAAVIVRACVESAKELGLPEARIPLANAVVTLACAPKSNTAYTAFDAAAADVRAGLGTEIPVILKSPRFKGYRYPHDYVNDYCRQEYLPEDLRGKKYYEFGSNKTEQAAKSYWEAVKSRRDEKK